MYFNSPRLYTASYLRRFFVRGISVCTTVTEISVPLYTHHQKHNPPTMGNIGHGLYRCLWWNGRAKIIIKLMCPGLQGQPMTKIKRQPISKICEATNILRNLKQPNWNMRMLENSIYQAAMNIGTFESTFFYCSYRWA